MPTPRLPQVGSDDNAWGEVLNGFLSVSHNDDGTLRDMTKILQGFSTLIKGYDSSLNLKGFAKVSDSTPAATLHDAYISTESGTIFGISTIQGQLLVGNGNVFTTVDVKNISASDIVTMLTGLSGDNRLSYTNLKDQLTGAGITTLISGLSGVDKLSYNALKDTPESMTSSSFSTEKKFKIKITPTNPATVSSIQMSIPPLKYNKKWAYAFTSDDGTRGVYQYMQKYFNGRYVETGAANWHDTMARTSGEYAPQKLTYSDGCGNLIPFRVEIAWLTRNNGGTDIHSSSTPEHSSAMQWSELVTFKDFFGGINNHEIGANGDAYVSLLENQTILYNKIGYWMTSHNEPNGDATYIPAARFFDFIYFMTSSGGHWSEYSVINLKAAYDFYKIITSRDSWYFETESDKAAILSDIATKVATVSDTVAPLVYHITHVIEGSGTFNGFKNMKEVFTTIYNLYGSAGDDSIWSASYSEIMEYAYQRRKTTITRSVVGSSVIFDIVIPEIQYFSWKEFSLLVDGITNTSDASVVVYGPAYGLSQGINNGKLLINIDYNANSLALADKYVALCEANSISQYISDFINDANFFINRLRPELRTSYQSRIALLAGAPTLNSVVINQSDTTTSSQTVSVVLNISGGATQYRISETADLSDSTWATLSGNTISYTFSTNVQETKTVYAQVKNDFNESSIMNDSIDYFIQSLTLSSIIINQGDVNVANTTASVALTMLGSATHYMISENANLSGASWIAYTGSTLTYTFTNSVSGAKTVYVQLKNDTEQSAIKSDSINYLGAVLSLDSIIINSGDVSTQSSTVSVGITYSNSTPTHYRIGTSSDLSAVSWVAWSGSPISYNLVNTGANTVYVQIKDSLTVSTTQNNSINYIPIELQSIIINSGGTSTLSTTVSVVFNYTGTPTVYMMSEDSNFSGASWSSWVGSSVSFVLSGSLGVKTLYAKIRNVNSNVSSVVSSSITLSAPEVNKIVISLAASAYNSSTYPTVNGEILNYTTYATYESYANLPLKNTLGVVKGNFVVKPSMYPADSTIKLLALGNSGSAPVLSGNTGQYPDLYIAKFFYAQNANTIGNRSMFGMINFQAGTYNVRILSSTSASMTESNRVKMFYQCNSGTPVVLAPQTINNTTVFTEINNVVVGSDGVLNVFVFNNSGLYSVPGLNLIEITQV